MHWRACPISLDVSFREVLTYFRTYIVQSLFYICAYVIYQLFGEISHGRYMKDLKAYVRNHARPEGCMAECYLAKESVTFCEEHMKRVESVNHNEKRNEDNNDESIILEGKPLLKGTPITLTEEMLKVAYLCVLFNFEEVQPYLE